MRRLVAAVALAVIAVTGVAGAASAARDTTWGTIVAPKAPR